MVAMKCDQCDKAAIRDAKLMWSMATWCIASLLQLARDNPPTLTGQCEPGHSLGGRHPFGSFIGYTLSLFRFAPVVNLSALS